MTARWNRWRTAGVCLVLGLVTLAVYWPVTGHGFVNYDDNDYVSENPLVARGLSVQGVVWALTHFHASNWHPLTWLSHMLDCQLYGLQHPGGHHLTSLLLHTVSAILLFLVLRGMTGDFWPAAFVAAVFAVHPSHVESVAWVAERKDVLSGLFFMLTLAAYAGYARRPFSFPRYLLVTVLWALGLMAKPMLVTLPFVLLLLDYWPLKRFPPPATAHGARDNNGRTPCPWPRRVLLEKLPWLGLAAASCVVTLLAQWSEAVVSLETCQLSWRMGNTLASYAAYLGQFFYPVGLAALYPRPNDALPTWKIAGAFLLLLGISMGVVIWRRRRPHLLVGWLWYLGMLVPVIGLVQIGLQGRADRYTYLPQIGLCLALAWAARTITGASAGRRRACTVVGLVAVLILGITARRQVSYWKDSETLWRHTLACTSNNFVAHGDLGLALAAKGRTAEAIGHYQRVLELKPDDVKAHNNLGLALSDIGKVEEAIGHYQKALTLKPDDVKAHNNLGIALRNVGKVEEAISHYRRALQLQPDYAPARYNLGIELQNLGEVEEAIGQFRIILELLPDHAATLVHLGHALATLGRVEEAIAQYQKALKTNPNDALACNNLAWIRATHPDPRFRDGLQAVTLAQRAVGRLPNDPGLLETLAAAYAEAGRFPEALQAARQGLALAQQENKNAVAESLEAGIRLYEAGTPVRESPQSTAPPSPRR